MGMSIGCIVADRMVLRGMASKDRDSGMTVGELEMRWQTDERRGKSLIHVDSREMAFLREMDDERWTLHIP